MKEYPHDISAAEIRDLIGPRDQLILEAGAWDGDTTYAMLCAMPDALIVAMEPDSRPLARLHARFDGREGGVQIVPAAAGAVNGVVPWYASHGDLRADCCRDGDWDLSSSLRRPEHHLLRAPEITFDWQEVRCVRIDDLPAEFPDIRFPRFYELAFIDVQGAQRDVIAGGRKTLDSTPWIYIELHHTPEYEGEPTFQGLCVLLPRHQAVARYVENILFRLE